jgi:hypothetical protein
MAAPTMPAASAKAMAMYARAFFMAITVCGSPIGQRSDPTRAG